MTTPILYAIVIAIIVVVIMWFSGQTVYKLACRVSPNAFQSSGQALTKALGAGWNNMGAIGKGIRGLFVSAPQLLLWLMAMILLGAVLSPVLWLFKVAWGWAPVPRLGQPEAVVVEYDPASIAVEAPQKSPSSPAPPGDWRKEWVTLMDEQIEREFEAMVASGLANGISLKNLDTVSSVPVEPGQARFGGEVILDHNPGHIWCSIASTQWKNIEYRSSLGQTQWRTPKNNPFRYTPDPGDDALTFRLRPEAKEPVTLTVERIVKKGQVDKSDVPAPKPAVRKIYRNVPGRAKVSIAKHILTQLPSGQRVESTVTVLLLGEDGIAINPGSPQSSLSVLLGEDDTDCRVVELKFEKPTVEKKNPPLIASPNFGGTYDIVVVLTPL